MSYCINPNCPNFDTPANQSSCPNCDPEILLQGRYRVIQPLGNGSFGQLFEVEDIRGAARDEGGTRKVLKVLRIDNYPPAVRLFQREAKVLSELDHPGIPKVEPDGYFRWSQHSSAPLHCLVMEKIEGINLQEWLSHRNNQPITQKQAITWLKQLAEILQQVHQRNYFHRDIKPSNIMLKPDGQLVLIDFGAVREVTATYLQYGKNGKGGTAIISPGYTPPEQADGRAVFTSDFYALGRTFVHLLTGIHPHGIDQCPQTDRLYWRKCAPHINQELADLIDRLTAPLSANRPRNAGEILKRLKEIETQIKSRTSTLEGNFLTEVPTKIINSRNNRIDWLFVLRLIVLLVLSGIAFPSSEAKQRPNTDDRTQQSTACDSIQDDGLSCGEEILVPDSGGISKQKGIQKFAIGDYEDAIKLLQKAQKEDLRDPETLIYLNNAKTSNQKAYTIAIAAPIGKNSNNADTANMAQEILRGVAQAQEEINQGGGINGIRLRVLIADDANNRVQAKQIAEKLVLKKEVLGVVGHYASEVTLEAIPIYQEHKLVVISPGSTSEKLSEWGEKPNHVFFRTVPTTKVAADYLIKHLNAQSLQKTAAVFNVPQSSFSRSLSDVFSNSFRASGGKVLQNEFDLSMSNERFDEKSAIDKAQKQGATVLAVFPDGGTSTYGISNTLDLVTANQGHSWIVGSNTLYSSKTLTLLGKAALNRFVVVVPWHSLDSKGNSEFLQVARNLWGGDVSWRTAMAYDATRALIVALEKQRSPSRESLRQIVADKNFQAQGATGTISFKGGDRKEEFSTLVKVVRSNCSPNSYTFVPVDYKDAGQDCRE